MTTETLKQAQIICMGLVPVKSLPSVKQESVFNQQCQSTEHRQVS